MKNKIVTHFYVKEEKKDNNGEAPIYLRITVNGERAEISTNRKINPELWDKTSQRVAGRTEPVRIINSWLNNLVSKVEKYFSNLDIKEELISVQQIIAELKGKSLRYQVLSLTGFSSLAYSLTRGRIVSFLKEIFSETPSV